MGKIFGNVCLFSAIFFASLSTQAREDVEDNDGYTFGDLTRRLVFYLDGQPWFRADQEIDRFVGVPWKVDQRTWRKFRSFPARVRLELLSQSLGTLNEIDVVVDENQVYRDYRGREGHYLLEFKPSPQTEKAVGESLERVLGDHFQDEDLIDLTVYALSKEGLFFQDEEAWEEGKSKLIHYALWPAVGIVVLQAIRNETRISSSGWVLRDSKKQWRMGWFAKGKNLGFTMDEPGYEGGISVRSPSTEWKLGANDSKEVKLAVRTFFLRNLGFGDVSSDFIFRTDLDEPFDFKNERGQLEGTIFARRPLGKERDAPKIVAQIHGETNFDSKRKLTVSAGLEWPTWLMLLRATPYQSEYEDDEDQDVALLVTGNLGSPPEWVRKRISNWDD